MHIVPLILFIIAAVIFGVQFVMSKNSNFTALGLCILTTAITLLHTIEGGDHITF